LIFNNLIVTPFKFIFYYTRAIHWELYNKNSAIHPRTM
jgi:hypothetical protein